MQENVKQVIVKMTARRAFRTEPIYQYDVGHELVFEGFELPAAFEVHFSRSPMGKAITQIGTNDVCTVPDMFAQNAGVVYAWLYIADTDSRLTKYSIEIPVTKRAKPTNQEPTPVEQSAIDQAIAALNAGVERSETAADAAESAQEAAEGYAEAAGNSAITATNAASSAASAKTAAETAARNAATSATDAHTSREAADQSATNAGVSERNAAASASAAASSASGAAQSASSASRSASSASEAAGAAVAAKGAAETAQAAAESAMETVAESAADAAESASTASGAATNAAQSASNASASATAAAGSATAAAGSASDAAEIKDYLDENYGEISEDVNSLKSALDMEAVSKTVSGAHIEITDAALNSNIISISGTAVMNNGNLLPDSYLSSAYITPYETEGFNFNRNGFAIVDNERLASILKPGLQYTVSFDFENLEIASEFAENYRYGILLQKSGTPLPGASALNDFMTESRFYVGYKQHFSSVISIPDDGIGDLKLLVYSGSEYNKGLSRISNLIIAGGSSELPWVQSQRIDVLAGETPEISYLPVYFDADESVVVEYMSDGISNNAIDKLNARIKTIETDEKRKKYTVNPHIKNICHRGYSKIAPEDTEPAYVYAKIAGYEYVENDLWFTSDGVPVMVHARDLSLVSNGTGNIDEVTYSYFKSLDFGQSSIYGDKYAGLKGSSLEEFVLLCKKLGLKIYLDCKSFSPVPTGYRSGAEKAVEILKKHQMENATSFLLSGSGVQVIRSLLPHARVGYMSNDHSAETIEYLASLATDGEVFINSDWRTITSDAVNSFHEAGISVEAWSADLGISNQRVKEIVDTGVDGITADGINLDAIITESLVEQYGF